MKTKYLVVILVVLMMLLCGCAGHDGFNGQQGIQGEQGVQGLQGIQGERGIQGEQGVPGIQGIQGEKGERGQTDYRAGWATINQNSNLTYITFTEKMLSPNYAVIVSVPMGYIVKGKTTMGFIVEFLAPTNMQLSFDWIAIPYN